MAKLAGGSLGEYDSYTNAALEIPVEHHEIHEGDFYEAGHIQDISTGAFYYIGIKTPSNKVIHYKNEKVVTSADKVTIGLQEDATITGGTTATVYNHNRLSAKTSSVIIKTGITLSTAGTTISTSYVGGGTNQGANRIGADNVGSNEYILKQNTQYVITLANSSSGTNTVFVSPTWYES
jgi:hypothetical protein